MIEQHPEVSGAFMRIVMAGLHGTENIDDVVNELSEADLRRLVYVAMGAYLGKAEECCQATNTDLEEELQRFALFMFPGPSE